MTARHIDGAQGWSSALRGSDPFADLENEKTVEIAIAEMQALRFVDEPRAVNDFDLAALDSPTSMLATRVDCDLPPPPVTARSGDAVFRSLSRFASTDAPSFSPAQKDERSLLSSSERAEAAAAAVALLRGIHGLEAEIRERISQSRRA
jgi:hypothetical protein